MPLPRPFKNLRKSQRNDARNIARDAWIASGGDPDKARAIVRDKLRNGYGSIIGTILIGLAIRLAFELIMYWWNNRVSEPAMEFTAGEPGADE